MVGIPRAPADPSAGLVFILGFPRSGTTLLGQILAAAPQVALLEEPELLSATAAQFVSAPDGIARLAALDETQIARHRQDFWARAQGLGIDLAGKIVVDQTALNTVFLAVIGKLFPDATVVFAIRDPRDVVVSCFRRRFEPSPFTLEFATLEGTARVYDRMMRFADLCRPRMAPPPLDIRYEDLLDDFDGVTRRLCARIGLPWREEMRDFHLAAAGRALTTVSAPQIRRGLTRDSVGAWRLYREHLAPALALLAPWVARFGYPAD